MDKLDEKTIQSVRELADLQDQARRTVRRIRRALAYHGSQNTDDFVQTLLVKWLKSGTLAQLLALPPGERYIGKSVRGIIIDRLRYHRANKRKGIHVSIDEPQLPEIEEVCEHLENHLLRTWLIDEIGALERGHVDESVHIRPKYPQQSGAILRLYANGASLSRIAEMLGLSLSTVSRRLKKSLMYLGVRAHKSAPRIE